MTLLTNARSVTCKAIRKATTSAIPRTLLLTFDAFDTLFHPRKPVTEQYASTAHEYGLSKTEITPEKLKATFKDPSTPRYKIPELWSRRCSAWPLRRSKTMRRRSSVQTC
ncbi:uncharacterized protein N7515_003049 [Penicillium bovifimosum]|uniref:Uncharacterized protein n=1 Tax=Penicillium bovifimosum TaxID=126998 RepID=A0A9W9HCU9_9EURO|nr:uncharacterized protein N7515_003049 [Penicillium bovifimosum]KAJ5144262.1 hypothetical protein N7515_003049 [Penicillium bovifimosum]